MKKNKKIHFVGIKGVGMAPLAIISKEAGFDVSGCDIDEEFITDQALLNAGIVAHKGFSKTHIKDIDLLITTGAHGGFDHPEVVEAKRLSIPIWTQGQAVGEFMKGEIFNKTLEGVSVSGSHGKTTTTAMMATVLKSAGLDPSFLVGTGQIPYLNSNGHFGKGKYFIAEADEYATEPKYDKTPKLLWQKPKLAVITNIELDHPDLYDTVEDLKKAFLLFINNMANFGTVIACLDDESTADLIKKTSSKVITYGFSKNADFNLERVSIEGQKMFFWVNNKMTSLGEFYLNVTGSHNALNALACIVACLELGLSVESIKKGLGNFRGTRRRFEFIKNLQSGALVYDDYAHHPTEIKKTLAAFKETFPGKKILCIFQPHTYSRTKKLFDQFVYSFSQADELVLLEIYSSLREEKDPTVSSLLLKNNIAKIHASVCNFLNLTDVVKYVGQKNLDSRWIILTMGAGDVYKIGEMLL